MDTSGIIAVTLNEPEKEAIIEATVEAILYAPLSLHWEFGNALTAMLKRHRIRTSQAAAAIWEYRGLPLNLVDVDVLQAVTLAETYHLYAYDAYMIVCAQSLGIPLLSLDRRLLDAAEAAGVVVVRI